MNKLPDWLPLIGTAIILFNLFAPQGALRHQSTRDVFRRFERAAARRYTKEAIYDLFGRIFL
jgi:hypothetical protein